MSITDELREWASIEVPYKYGHQLNAIADRIDVEYEDELQDMHNVAYSKGFMDAMKERASWASWHEDEMAEYGWIRLPKDADGVPIRVGDKLRFENGMIVEVRYLKIDSEGTSVCVLATNGGGDFYAIIDKAHHYHELTIEDVLRELVGKAQALSNVDDEDELVTEFAKRLTLAGDAE